LGEGGQANQIVNIKTYPDRQTMSRSAAAHAADALRRIIVEHGCARIIAATGASQIDFLEALTSSPGIDWSSIEMFHLDEYVGLPVSHRASFRRYLLDRLINKAGIGRYHLLNGDEDPSAAARTVGTLVAECPVDLAFVGIGENCHLAFNDPPADFTTDDPYLIVTLDEACRRQQVGEGWFASIDDVPARAISMSVRQILKSKDIIAVVPDARKAAAVKACVEGPVSPIAPASILQTHPNTTLYLDEDSAALLTR
jgi:glucosamine-6-phosphate deaminase